MCLASSLLTRLKRQLGWSPLLHGSLMLKAPCYLGWIEAVCHACITLLV